MRNFNDSRHSLSQYGSKLQNLNVVTSVNIKVRSGKGKVPVLN